MAIKQKRSHQERGASTNVDLVARSGLLKRALVDFALSRRFASDLNKEFARTLHPGSEVDEAKSANVIDYFILQRHLPDGRTVLQHFVSEHPDLSDAERTMLLGWHDVVEGIFEIERRDKEALVVVNLVDELTYRVRSNVGTAAFSGMSPGSFLITRLVPISDEWLLSGIASMFPAGNRAEIHRLAADFAQQHPAMLFRNPEKLAEGWELQREERKHFIAFFGADLVIVPGRELAENMRAYMRFRMFEARDADGKTAADHTLEVYGTETPELEMEFPLNFLGSETVGLIYDEVEGLNFYANYGQLADVFASPKLATQRDYRRAVLEYLKEPSISTLPFRRLAERNDEHASRVLQVVLKQPAFDWQRDGEKLLRRYKKSWFEQPILPSITPVGDPLARAQMDSGEVDSGDTQPGPRSIRRPKRRPGRFQ